MNDRQAIAPLLTILIIATAVVSTGRVSADEFAAGEHKRQTIYHSPQKPGFTSWVGAWSMPGGDLMVCFTQATGPIKDRAQAPKDVQVKLNLAS